MLARVTRLEGTDGSAPSPFERIYGSLAGFTHVARVSIDAGALDRLDGEVLITIIARWHADGVWDAWQ